MRRGLPPFGRELKVERHGYTIVEVMVFLAVTSFLFAMIALTFAGQRGRTQFQAGARDMESRIRDITNDVSTGFQPQTADFICQEAGGSPDIQAGSAPQGTNVDCVSIGRVVQFKVGGDGETYAVYSVVGLRQSGGQDVTNYDEASPTTDLLLQDEQSLPAAMSVAYVRTNGTSPQDLNAVGFFSSLGSYSEEGTSLESGSLSVNVLPITGLGGGGTPNSAEEMVAFINNEIDQDYMDANQNPSDGIVVCLNSGTSDQHAILTIGGSGRQLTTDLFIDNGACV